MSWKNYFQRNELSRLASHKGGDIASGVTVRYGRGIAPVLWADVGVVPREAS